MSSVVLYNPKSSPAGKAVMPLSLLAVGAMLEGRTSYRIVDGNLVPDALDVLDQAVGNGTRVIGMTVMPGPQLEQAVPLTRELKRRHRDLRVVWGGYFPTMYPETVSGSGLVDVVVRGHNDLSLGALFEALAEGQSPEAVITGPSALPDMNALPPFPYHRIDVSGYARKTFMGRRTLSHHSSYGCPFECNFCAVVNMVGGRYRAESAERAAGVTRRLVDDYGADAVEFYDNNFFVDEVRTAEFCGRIEKLGIQWWAYGRIDTMLRFSDRTWHAMASSGLRMVFLGAETGSDEGLARMNKGGVQTVEQAVEIAGRMRAHGIVPEMSFMLGNPPDPEEDAERTMRFIGRVKRANPETEVVLYIYAPVPVDGALYRLAAESGFNFPSTLEEWSRSRWTEFAQHRTSALPWMTRKLHRRIHDYQRVLHAAFPTVTDRNLTGIRRTLLRAAGTWRYRTGLFRYPIELRALGRLIPYQRPDTAGF